MARLLAFLTLFAACACDQQSAYSPYSPYAPYSPYYQQQTSGWQSDGRQPAYVGGQRQQTRANQSASQPRQWQYPDGTVRWGTYDPNTGIMK